MTSSDRADLLVVGASFAGVACAIEAKRAGLRVILIERKTDAGEKLHTTGIVVKEAADEINRPGQFPPELIRPIRGVRLYGSQLASGALAVAARVVYFHRRGLLSPRAWKDLLRR